MLLRSPFWQDLGDHIGVRDPSGLVMNTISLNACALSVPQEITSDFKWEFKCSVPGSVVAGHFTGI